MEPSRGSDRAARSLSESAREIANRELVRYALRTPQSERAMARAERVLRRALTRQLERGTL